MQIGSNGSVGLLDLFLIMAVISKGWLWTPLAFVFTRKHTVSMCVQQPGDTGFRSAQRLKHKNPPRDRFLSCWMKTPVQKIKGCHCIGLHISSWCFSKLTPLPHLHPPIGRPYVRDSCRLRMFERPHLVKLEQWSVCLCLWYLECSK